MGRDVLVRHLLSLLFCETYRLHQEHIVLREVREEGIWRRSLLVIALFLNEVECSPKWHPSFPQIV